MVVRRVSHEQEAPLIKWLSRVFRTKEAAEAALKELEAANVLWQTENLKAGKTEWKNAGKPDSNGRNGGLTERQFYSQLGLAKYMNRKKGEEVFVVTVRFMTLERAMRELGRLPHWNNRRQIIDQVWH